MLMIEQKADCLIKVRAESCFGEFGNIALLYPQGRVLRRACIASGGTGRGAGEGGTPFMDKRNVKDHPRESADQTSSF